MPICVFEELYLASRGCVIWIPLNGCHGEPEDLILHCELEYCELTWMLDRINFSGKRAYCFVPDQYYRPGYLFLRPPARIDSFGNNLELDGEERFCNCCLLLQVLSPHPAAEDSQNAAWFYTIDLVLKKPLSIFSEWQL